MYYCEILSWRITDKYLKLINFGIIIKIKDNMIKAIFGNFTMLFTQENFLHKYNEILKKIYLIKIYNEKNK